MMYMIASLLFHMALAMSLRADKTGGDILWSGSKISLLTMETRATNQLRLLNNPPKNYYVENVGAGVKIRNKTEAYLMKVKLVKEWLEEHLKKQQFPPSHMVAFMDSDVMYAGCSEEEFEHRVELITRASGAKVVFGAEFNCFQAPVSCKVYPETHRTAVLKAFSLPQDQMTKWALSDKMQLKYLNSGFVVGRADALLDVYQKWYSLFNNATVGMWDGGYAQKIFVDHPELVTLDYAGALVNNLREYSMERTDKQQLFTWKRESQRWFDNANHMDACFFHGNGVRGKRKIKALLTRNAKECE